MPTPSTASFMAVTLPTFTSDAGSRLDMARRATVWMSCSGARAVMAIIRSNIEELVSKMSDLSVIPAVPRRLTRSGPRAWCWSTAARTAATLNGFVLALDTHATVSNPLFSSCNAVLFNELVPTDLGRTMSRVPWSVDDD